MYNAWRQQTADVSVIHNYIDNEKWLESKANILYTATYNQLKKYFRLSQCFILWLDGSAYDLPLPCDSPPSLIKVPE